MTGHEGLEIYKIYSTAISLTSALNEVGSQPHAPTNLHPGKTQCPWFRRLGVPQDLSGPVRKISPPPEFDPPTVQPVGESVYRLSFPGPPNILLC